MLDWLRYRYELARLRQKEREFSRAYQKAIQWATNQQKPQDEIDRLMVKYASEAQISADAIGVLQTTYLTGLARKRLVPVPQGTLPLAERGNDKWRTTKHGALVYLNDDGIRELSMALRADKRERLEMLRSWLTGLTGVIGALIGLLALILGRE